MASGFDLLELANTRIGESYENVPVPKTDPNWHGPWDCAELVTWVVYQITGNLYGCTDNNDNPAVADAYSGAWCRDVKNGILIECDRATANTVAGVVLLRRPPKSKSMGHVAISDGKGGTVEAAGHNVGVISGEVEGRDWDYFAMIPDVTYDMPSSIYIAKPIPYLLKLRKPPAEGPLIFEIQLKLKAAGFNPGPIDGVYGPKTVSAVCAFQNANQLISDGAFGPKTANMLGILWP